MKNRRDVGDLSFTEQELQELRRQEESERRNQAPGMPPVRRPKTERSPSWVRLLRFMTLTRDARAGRSPAREKGGMD